MRIVLILTLATAVLAGSVLTEEGKVDFPLDAELDASVFNAVGNDNHNELQLGVDDENDTVMFLSGRGIASWQLRRVVRKIQKQMPYGWPKHGIPPIAPLNIQETEISFKKSILDTNNNILRFRIDGLDDFVIKKLKINTITGNIKFNFLFHNVTTSIGEYETNTTLDALRQLGLTVQYEGNGSLEFSLENFRLVGNLKYKLPLIWGSAKITTLRTEVAVEKCTFNITGLMGNDSINRMINRQIESFVERAIKNNTQRISDVIEKILVPKVNQVLKGKGFWTVIKSILYKPGFLDLISILK